MVLSWRILDNRTCFRWFLTLMSAMAWSKAESFDGIHPRFLSVEEKSEAAKIPLVDRRTIHIFDPDSIAGPQPLACYEGRGQGDTKSGFLSFLRRTEYDTCQRMHLCLFVSCGAKTNAIKNQLESLALRNPTS